MDIWVGFLLINPISYQIQTLCFHGQGGGGSTKSEKVLTEGRGEGGLKIIENVRTSFMDVPYTSRVKYISL